MHQIRYKVSIKYKDFDNSIYITEYEIFASDKEDARTIALELFFMNCGAFEDMQTKVEAVRPDEDEKLMVNRKLIETFGVIKQSFTNKTYKDFLNAFINFQGHNLKLKPNHASFWFKFMDLECKAIYDNGISTVSEEEVIYHCSNGRKYVIRNNLCDILIGG